MENIKSKFSTRLIFLMLLVLIGVISSLFLCILPYFVDITLEGPGDSTLLWLSLIILIPLTVIIVQANKLFKKIIINDSGIMVSQIFGRKHYAWCDLSIINAEFYSNDGDAIEFSTNDLRKLKFNVDVYSNRSLLYQVFNFAKTELDQGEIPRFEKFSYIETPRRIAIEGLSRFVAYGQNQLLTFNTIAISFFMGINVFGFIPFIFKSEISALKLSMSIGFCVLFFVLCYVFARQMCYFQINDTYLLVRHPFLPISRTYLLSDIQQVAITIAPKSSIALRVLTLNYNSDIFHAGGMRNREWSRLLLHLKKNGVSLRNDSVTKSFMKHR